MKIIVAGGRDFYDYALLCKKLDVYLSSLTEIEIVSGGARGADGLGERYATEKGHKLTTISAEWDKLGKKAGYVRNRKMAEYADMCVCFWDGESKGTKHMIDLAREFKLPLRIVKYERRSN